MTRRHRLEDKDPDQEASRRRLIQGSQASRTLSPSPDTGQKNKKDKEREESRPQ